MPIRPLGPSAFLICCSIACLAAPARHPVFQFPAAHALSGQIPAAVAVDSRGFVYLAGAAPASGRFPRAIYVTRLDPSGHDAIYIAYLGGSGLQQVTAVAVDAGGNAYVTGYTSSADFPVIGGVQKTHRGLDAFVAKLDGKGNWVYSTYLGGAGGDIANAIAVDQQGNAYVTGRTAATGGFLAEIGANGATLHYASDLGISGNAIAMDSSGAIFIAGGDGRQATVLKRAADGSNFEQFAVFGGAGRQEATALALDPQGAVYVAGWTDSPDFPVTAGASDVHGRAAFAAKFAADGAHAYATLPGGAEGDAAPAIAADGLGNAYIAAGRPGWLVKLSASGDRQLANESVTAGQALALAGSGRAIVVGAGASGQAYAARVSTCDFRLSEAIRTVGADGGPGSLSVETSPECGWQAASGASWLQLSGSGAGDGTFTYRAATNHGAARETSIVVGGETVIVTQDAGRAIGAGSGAIRGNAGFHAVLLNGCDDCSAADAIDLGFPIDFYGRSYSQAFVNANGNITFGNPNRDYTPAPLASLRIPMMAPFWADVDTRNPAPGAISYGRDVVEGHTAFGVNWTSVGYFAGHQDKLNSFQLVLIDRSDLGAGAFDIEMNYGAMEWETGDASGTASARAGYTNGTGLAGTYMELPDAQSLAGRHTFNVRPADNVAPLPAGPRGGTLAPLTTTLPGAITEYTAPTANSQPYGIAAGPDGALWFTEFGTAKVARVTTGGSFTEYPLSPPNAPFVIVPGPDGLLWLTNNAVGNVTKVTTGGTPTVYTLPGSQDPTAGITVGPDGALWLVRPGGWVGRITTSGSYNEFMIPTNGSNPYGITAGPDGALWFTEQTGDNIGRITTTGSFTEYHIPTADSVPWGITTGSDGALWFAEGGAGKIGRITTTGSFTEYVIPTPNSNPVGITSGPDGALWFAEANGNNIGRITTGGSFTEYPIPTASSQPEYIAVGSDGALWFTEQNGNKIGRIFVPALSIAVSHTGNFLQGQTGATYRVAVSNAPADASSGGTVTVTETVPSGLTLVSMSGSGWTCPATGNTCTRSNVLTGGSSYPAITVTVNVASNASSPQVNSVSVSGGGSGAATANDSTTINPPVGGAITEYAVPTVPAQPMGIAAGPDGALWFAEYAGGKIGRITTAGSITEYTVPTPSSIPVGITAGPDGLLWFTESSSGKIGKVTTGGSFTEYTIPTQSSQPLGIAAGPNGALWFTEFMTSKIGTVTTAGSFTEYAVPTASSSPYGIAAGPDGALWFTEESVSKIGRITTAGSFTEYTTPTPGSGPYGITAGPDGALWFSEGIAGNIGRVTTSGSFVEYPIPTPMGEPFGITAGPDGALWFSEVNGNNIGRITTGGSITEYPIPIVSAGPRYVAAGSDGAIWYTEFSGNNIGRILTPPVLSILKSHTGNFTQGQAGAIYTVMVSNGSGAPATSGTVTVTETVPAGMTLVSMSGTNWNCPPNTNTCSRSDPLQPGNSYPTLTVTVNLSSSATSPQVNQVMVSGGGSTTANISDSTTVLPAPASITATQGSGQSTPVSSVFPMPLQATVKDGGGNPMGGLNVTFTAPAGPGAGGTFGGSGSQMLTTDASGHAAAAFTANSTLGSYNVTATVSGVASAAFFSLTNTAGAPASITATQGSGQTAVVNTAFATTLQATVRDAFGNPVSGTSVTFSAPGSGPGGKFGSSSSAIVSTNALGVATAPAFTANGSTGTYTVTASVNGAGAPANFSLTNTTAAPTLVITKTHTGNYAGDFTQSQTGATFTVTVSNSVGSPSTNGTVTVTDTLPAGLTLVGMSGGGWSCTANSCSRADPLMGGLSYPAITVTVNVSATAASSLTNTAVVSGGGSASPVTAHDTVSIVPIVGCTSLTFNDTIPGPGSNQSCLISNPNGLTLTTSVSPNAPWLGATAFLPPYLSVNDTLIVIANLQPGVYTGTVTVLGNGSVVGMVAVTLNLTASASVSPASNSVSSAGAANASFGVTTAGAWAIVNGASWITIENPMLDGSGNLCATGNGSVNYTVAPNTAPNVRTATLTLLSGCPTAGAAFAAGTFTLTQAAQAGCNSAAGTSFPAGQATSFTYSANGTAGNNTAVLLNDPCSAPVSQASWITVASSSSSFLTFSVAAYTGSTARNGSIQLGPDTINVTQNPPLCTYSVASTSGFNSIFPATGGPGSMTIGTSSSLCSWTATPSSASFITALSSGSGTGPATVTFTIPPNMQSTAQSGTISVQGVKYAVTQAAASPTQPSYTCTVTADPSRTLRAEGVSELTADLVLACNGTSAGGVMGDVIVTLSNNTTVTNHTLSSDPTDTKADALLLNMDVANPAWAIGSNAYQGLVAGPRSIRFRSVSLAPEQGAFSHIFRLTNVRVDASHVAGLSNGQSAPPIVTAALTIQPPLAAPAAGAPFQVPARPLIVGQVPSTAVNGAGGTTYSILPSSNFSVGALAATSGTSYWPLTFTEQQTNAYLPALASGQAPNSTPGVQYVSESGFVNSTFGTETGYSNNGRWTAANAAMGTRLMATISNVPCSANLYAPVEAVGSGAQLVSADSSGAGGFPAVSSSFMANGVTFEGYQLLTLLPANGAAACTTTGSATITWEVTAALPGSPSSLTFNLYVIGNANLSGVTFTGGPAPLVTVSAPGATAPVPRFNTFQNAISGAAPAMLSFFFVPAGGSTNGTQAVQTLAGKLPVGAMAGRRLVPETTDSGGLCSQNATATVTNDGAVAANANSSIQGTGPLSGCFGPNAHSNGSVCNCNASVPPGGQYQCSATTTSCTPGSYAGYATSDQGNSDPNSSDTVQPPSPIVSLTTLQSPTAFTQGDTSGDDTLTVRVTNTGDDAPAGVISITQTLPPNSGLTVASVAPHAGSIGDPYSQYWVCTSTAVTATCTYGNNPSLNPSQQPLLNSARTPLGFTEFTITFQTSSAASGDVNDTLQLTTNLGGNQYSTAYTPVIAIEGSLQITAPASSTLPQATVGAPYTFSGFSASGGSGSYTWSATGLPAGLTMSAAGTIFGTPSSAATALVVVSVADAANASTPPKSNTYSLSAANPAITIQTSPTGLQFTVDGGAVQTAPKTLTLAPGPHTIAVAATQGARSQDAAGTQYVFLSWSDGGAASHSITAGSSLATYTATFQTSYLLTISASPAAGGTVSPSSGVFYSVGSVVPVTATANTQFAFSGWSGGVANAASASTSVTMSAPETLVANFALTESGFTISPTSISVAASAGNGAVMVTAPNSTATWTAASNNSFLTITSGASGTGNGSVGYSVAANTTTSSRTGTLTIAGLTFTVTQVVITTAGLGFYPVTPCRFVDTREGQGFTGQFGPPSMTANQTRSFTIPSSGCNIPTTAQAYSLNVTVVPHAGLGYLTIWPAGQSQPLVSTLNSSNGAILANAAIVPAGTGGAVSVFVTNATDLIIDINGYFATPTATALAFYPVTPCRVADTRNGSGPFGGPSLPAGGTRSFTVPSSTCGIPTTAQAYSLNTTVVPPGPLTYLTVWPTGQTQPNVSTLNVLQGQIAANAAIVPAGTNGAVSVFVSDPSNVIIDINGYFAPPGAGALYFYPLTPCRIADTRNGTGALGGPSLGAGASRTFPIPTSSCAVPTAAQAYSLNMTVVPPGPLLYLSAWPAGQTQPVVSTLNDLQGQIVANAAIVPAGSAGGISVFVSDATNLVIDVNGYFGQ